MRIGINLLPYREVAGIVIYIHNLLQNLEKIDQEDDFFIFIGKNPLTDLKFNYKNFHYVKTSIDSYRKIKRVLYEQLVFPFRLKKYKIDVLFNPSVSGPIFWPGKKIATIHDCAYDRFKEFDSLRTKIYFKLMLYGTTRLFSTIITDSNFSKEELIKIYKTNSQKIKVVYGAAPDLPEVKEEFIKKTLNKFKIEKPYFLYIGSSRPRKNLSGLIKSFKIFREKGFDYLLVIGGRKDKRFLDLEREILDNQLEGKVILTDTLSREEVSSLYKRAKALTFPSFYEGFGLPVLEAQSLGIPVLTSNISSLPEVGGDSVLYVNPYNIEEIAKGMEKIAFDENLRQDLIQKGYENIKRFSWEKSAKQLLKLFYSL